MIQEGQACAKVLHRAIQTIVDHHLKASLLVSDLQDLFQVLLLGTLKQEAPVASQDRQDRKDRDHLAQALAIYSVVTSERFNA